MNDKEIIGKSKDHFFSAAQKGTNYKSRTVYAIIIESRSEIAFSLELKRRIQSHCTSEKKKVCMGFHLLKLSFDQILLCMSFQWEMKGVHLWWFIPVWSPGGRTQKTWPERATESVGWYVNNFPLISIWKWPTDVTNYCRMKNICGHGLNVLSKLLKGEIFKSCWAMKLPRLPWAI